MGRRMRERQRNRESEREFEEITVIFKIKSKSQIYTTKIKEIYAF